MRLRDRVAVITGGGSGIGMETATLFSSEGARVSVCDFNRENGERTVRRIRETG